MISERHTPILQQVEVGDAPGQGAYRAALDHAWKWFTVQSSHRLQFVNYWVVFVGLLTSALVPALRAKAWGVSALVAVTGAMITVCFQLLDRRTRELIQASEAALRRFQADLAVRVGVPEMEILRKVHEDGRHVSYRVVIGVLHGSATVVFLVSAVYAMVRWST